MVDRVDGKGEEMIFIVLTINCILSELNAPTAMYVMLWAGYLLRLLKNISKGDKE